MAAGQGFIEFATGDVLTAASANGYLASQVVMVFASAAARTSAIASPQEGMISYLKDTNSTEYYSGSAWVAIGGGGSSGSYTVIASGTLSGTSQSTTSIAGTYKKLIAIYDNFYVSGTDTTPRIRINTISTSTYNVQRLNPTDGSNGSARLTSGFQMDEVNAGTSSSNDNQVVLIIDGYASNTFHSYQINFNPTNGNEYVYFGANTSIGDPVTSIQFQTQNGTTSWAGGTYAVYGVN
jgi:hypothetical protein